MSTPTPPVASARPANRRGRVPTVLTPARQAALAAVEEARPWDRWERQLPGYDWDIVCDLEDTLNDAVIAARAAGCTWKWIGDAMHISAPGALMWWQRANIIEPKHRPETIRRRDAAKRETERVAERARREEAAHCSLGAYRAELAVRDAKTSEEYNAAIALRDRYIR